MIVASIRWPAVTFALLACLLFVTLTVLVWKRPTLGRSKPIPVERRRAAVVTGSLAAVFWAAVLVRALMG